MSTDKQQTKLEGIPQDKMQVWQLSERQFLNYLTDRPVVWPDDYHLAALVDTGSVEEAFRWTNDGAWRRREIKVMSPGGWRITFDENGSLCLKFICPRSTSVGDVLITPQGVGYIVQSFGFGQMDEV